MKKHLVSLLALAGFVSFSAFAEEGFKHEYENGGHYEASTWVKTDHKCDPEKHAAHLAMGKLHDMDAEHAAIEAGLDPSVSLPAPAAGDAYKSHPYMNGGNFGGTHEEE